MVDKIYIVGAHSRAKTLAIYLKKLYQNIEIVAYIVDNDEDNASSIEGVPVCHLEESNQLEVSYPIYIATRGIYHAKLIEKLQRLGMKNIIPVTPELDMNLRNRFLKMYYEEMGRGFDKLVNSQDLRCIYIVKSIFDKPSSQTKVLSVFEKEIQVGAALTEQKICEITDDTGENISEKNKQFCELTAMYWIWKNSKEEIVGLEHYRRRFILPADWYQQMEREGIDVILPTPLYVMPSIAVNYIERHMESDWNYMMEYIKIKLPEYYEQAVIFFEGTGVYSPCNMFIMRKEILNELCMWLFPILFACSENIGRHDDLYQNRYPGFMAERLVSFFFEVNRDKYKVVYADKNFLG